MYWKSLANRPKLLVDTTDLNRNAKNSVSLIENLDLICGHLNDLIQDLVEYLLYVEAIRNKQRRVIDQDRYLPWNDNTIIVYASRRNLFYTIYTNGKVFPVPVLLFDLEIRDRSVKHRLS